MTRDFHETIQWHSYSVRVEKNPELKCANSEFLNNEPERKPGPILP